MNNLQLATRDRDILAGGLHTRPTYTFSTIDLAKLKREQQVEFGPYPSSPSLF